MRKLGIAILVIVVLVIAAALIVPHVIDVNKYHNQIQAELQKKLGRQVSLGEMTLSVLPLSFRVADPIITEDPSFNTGRPFATAQELAVSIKFWPLLRKDVEIKSFELNRPKIELARDAQGAWNFATLGQPPKASPAQPETAPQAGRQAAQANPSPAPEQNPQAQGSKSAGNLELASLQINDGQVAITDLQKHQSRAVYDHIDIAVSNFAPDQQFSLKVAAHLPGQGKQTLSLEGSGGPIQQANLLNTSFDGTLHMDQVSIAGVEKFLNSQALSGIEGQLSGDAKVKNSAGKLASSGNIRLDNAQIQNVNVGYPITLDYDVADDLTSDVIQIQHGDLRIGATPMTIAGTVNSKPTPAEVDVKLTAQNTSIGDLARLASAFGSQNISGSGTLNLNVQAQGPTSNLNLNGSGKIQNASLKISSTAQPVQIYNADLNFSQNTATIQNLAASVGQSDAKGSLTLKNFAAPQVQFTLNSDKINVADLQQLMNAAPAPAKKAANADFWRVVPKADAQPIKANQPGMLDKMTGGGTIAIGTLQSNDLVLTNVHSNVSLNHGLIQLNPLTSQLFGGQETGSVSIDMRPAQPIYTANLKTDKVDANKLMSAVSSVKDTLYGLLASNVNASLTSTASNSANAMMSGLNGTVGINLTNGKLANVDMLHELGSVAKFVGGSSSSSKGFTAISQLSGTFNVKNGVAQTNDLKAVIDGGSLAATGTANLVNNALDMHATAVLSKSTSQQAGGTQVGGMMNTALANQQGELVIPVIVTGTFQHPQVAPDVQQLAQMKLHNLLPTSANPGGILGALSGKNQGKGGLGGILGGLAGQQNQQQQNNGAVGNNAGQQQPPANQNPLGNALNQVLGKKKQQQQQQNQKPPE